MKRKLVDSEADATRFAQALVSTCQRYMDGMMTHPTWKSHMRSLWGQIEHQPRAVQARVRELIDPLGREHKALWQGAERRG